MIGEKWFALAQRYVSAVERIADDSVDYNKALTDAMMRTAETNAERLEFDREIVLAREAREAEAQVFDLGPVSMRSTVCERRSRSCGRSSTRRR